MIHPEPVLDYKDQEWPEPDDPSLCLNCGCYGNAGRSGEYECPNCGDVWDICWIAKTP